MSYRVDKLKMGQIWIFYLMDINLNCEYENCEQCLSLGLVKTCTRGLRIFYIWFILLELKCFAMNHFQAVLYNSILDAGTKYYINR